MKEQNDFIKWIKKHKTELIIYCGLSATALLGIILGIKNQEEIKEEIKSIWASVQSTVTLSTVKVTDIKDSVESSQEPIREIVNSGSSDLCPCVFWVREHIRNLPDGYHASPKKIAEALENDIILEEGQTLVDTYTKGGAAA